MEYKGRLSQQVKGKLGIVQTVPMNFSYGHNSIPGTQGATTFDAIALGERTSTLRQPGKPGAISPLVRPGDLIEIYDSNSNRGILAVATHRERVDFDDENIYEQLSETERWKPQWLQQYLNKDQHPWEVLHYEPLLLRGEPAGGGCLLKLTP